MAKSKKILTEDSFNANGNNQIKDSVILTEEIKNKVDKDDEENSPVKDEINNNDILTTISSDVIKNVENKVNNEIKKTIKTNFGGFGGNESY